MKRKFTVRPKMIKASSTVPSYDSIAEYIIEYIKKRVNEANEELSPEEPYVLGFINGDEFAYAVDDAVRCGSISACIEAAKSAVEEGIEDKEEILDLVFEAEVITLHYWDEIIDAFSENGKKLPDWYVARWKEDWEEDHEEDWED